MIKIINAQYHRNGVGGEPFYAILFTDTELPRAGHTMIASYFKDCELNGFISVFSIPKLYDGNVKFGQNSWRGDRYATLLKPLLKEYLGEEPFA